MVFKCNEILGLQQLRLKTWKFPTPSLWSWVDVIKAHKAFTMDVRNSFFILLADFSKQSSSACHRFIRAISCDFRVILVLLCYFASKQSAVLGGEKKQEKQ